MKKLVLLAVLALAGNGRVWADDSWAPAGYTPLKYAVYNPKQSDARHLVYEGNPVEGSWSTAMSIARTASSSGLRITLNSAVENTAALIICRKERKGRKKVDGY